MCACELFESFVDRATKRAIAARGELDFRREFLALANRSALKDADWFSLLFTLFERFALREGDAECRCCRESRALTDFVIHQIHAAAGKKEPPAQVKVLRGRTGRSDE